MQRGADDKMFHCETCTRILYYIADDSSASSAPPASQASA